jgi:hypothetical protein
MDSVGSKLNLDERGRRYDHYMELKEVFLLGIDIIDRMNPNYVTEADKEIKRKLEIDYLCNYSTEASGYSDLAREIDRISVHRTPLSAAGSPNEQTQKQDSNHKSTQEDSGGETANA